MAKWVKFRHKVVFCALRGIFKPTSKSYNFQYERYKIPKNQPHLILCNHQTKADQFLLGLMFDRPIYFVARDDLFSLGFWSKIIKYLVAPIPKNKVSKDIQTIRDCMTVAREGGIIALFPEGNLTFSGTTEYIDPSTAKLVKLLKLPLIFVNFKGGYGVRPRWSLSNRKGTMTGNIVKTMQPSEYEHLSVEEIYSMICNNLYVDDRTCESKYISKENAMRLESCLYVCPECGLTTFSSTNDTLYCNNCGYMAKYTDELRFVGDHLYYDNVKDWYDYQKNYVRSFDFASYKGKPLFSDKVIKVMQENNRKKKLLVKKAEISLYADKLIINAKKNIIMPIADITAMAVLGRNKLEISDGTSNYYIICEPSFNALKYVHFFYQLKNNLNPNNVNEHLGI